MDAPTTRRGSRASTLESASSIFPAPGKVQHSTRAMTTPLGTLGSTRCEHRATSRGDRGRCRDALAIANGGPEGRLLAATARREIDVTHSPALFAHTTRSILGCQSSRNSLIGRGVIALSAEGRGRFGRFPDLVADDLFLDPLYMASEKREIDSVTVRVAAPERHSRPASPSDVARVRRRTRACARRCLSSKAVLEVANVSQQPGVMARAMSVLPNPALLPVPLVTSPLPSPR